jgi:hypothetical protein
LRALLIITMIIVPRLEAARVCLERILMSKVPNVIIEYKY